MYHVSVYCIGSEPSIEAHYLLTFFYFFQKKEENILQYTIHMETASTQCNVVTSSMDGPIVEQSHPR